VRALVTGAAGFVGSHLVERLLYEGARVMGLDSFNEYYDPGLKRENLRRVQPDPAFRLVEASVADAELLPLLDEVDVVYHLAGQPGVRMSRGHSLENYVRENVITTQRLLEAAKTAELRRLVFSSSSSVYGADACRPSKETCIPRPMSAYGVTKLAAERLCRHYWTVYGVPTVCLRYFTVYGPRQRPDMAFSRFVKAAIANGPLAIHGDGHQRRDFTYVGDAVAATVAAAAYGAPGAVYNVAGGSQVALNDAIGILESLLGITLSIEHLAPHSNEVRATWADTTAARRDLGYAPRTTLEVGLALQLAAEGCG
jgi:nucleoside-diphosphate-sugar epimerase